MWNAFSDMELFIEVAATGGFPAAADPRFHFGICLNRG
jgi:hypothetical protein